MSKRRPFSAILRPDWLGHMRECCGLGIMTTETSHSWGVRVLNGPLHDVDGGYRTMADAETSLALYAKFNLPRAEIVKKIDGIWCNCW